MALSVLNNIASLTAQNELSVTNSNLQNTLFQLSSGSRINSGADDPAGLSIANGLQANITALTQSAQNATDGIGELQVADGALSQVTTLLNRAVTLATEAANGGLTNPQYTAINNEYNSILNEVSRIGGATNFNGTPVFVATNVPNPNASDSANSTAVGAALTNAATFTVGVGGTNYTFTPGTAASNWVVSANAVGSPTTQLVAGESLTLNGSAYTTNTLGYTTSAGGLTLSTALTAGDELKVSYNGSGNNVDYVAGSNATMQSLLGYINNAGAQYGITASIVGGNLQISGAGTTQGAGNLTIATENAGLLSDINGGPTAPTLTANQTTTISELAQQINNSNATTNLTATVSSTGALSVQDSAGNITVGTNTISALGGMNKVSTVQNLINWINGGLGAGVSGVSATLSSGTTGTLDIVDNLTRNDLTATSTDTVLGTMTAPTMTTGNAADNVFISDGEVSNPNYYSISVPIGGLTTSNIGGQSTTIGAYGTGGTYGSITETNAPNALTAINSAISNVAAMRGSIGAGINRLNSATNVINTQVQNLTSAQSSIQDANVGQVVANLSKYQILEQTGISSLAQANQNQQAVLKLLQ